MMSKIIIGRYIPSDSIIHRMDPRGKIIATFLFIFVIFLANNWQSYLIVTFFTLLSIYFTKLKVKMFWDGVKPLLGLILFTSLLQLFFAPSGKIYWQWWIFSISTMGTVNAIYIFLRFSLIILISTVMTLTTMPLEIAAAFEWIMSPLKFFKVPVAEISLIMSIALRFVPTLFDQTVKIMNAQRARGADFSSGNLIQRIKAIVPLLVPLFINSLEVAIDLATAMESRGYRSSEGRTRYRTLAWSKYDLYNLGFFMTLTILLMVFRRY